MQSLFARSAAALFVVLISIGVRFANAAPGELDTTFNSTGRVLTTFGGVTDVATAMVVQPDQKIVVVGYCSVQGDDDFCLARYLANGQLDQSFGTNGKVQTIVGSGNDRARAVALQADGKIVVAGDCESGGFRANCAVRYETDGDVDTTFGSSGKLVYPSATDTNAQINSVAISPDGTIVFAGELNDPANNATLGTLALRTATGGTLGGVNIGSFSSPNSVYRFTAVAIQNDGKPVIVGQSGNNRIVRRTIAGSTTFASDPAFNSGNPVLLPLSGTGPDRADDIAIQPDGKLIVSGACTDGVGSRSICVRRLTSAGAIDSSLGNDAALIKIRDSNTRAIVGLQADGKLVVSGPCTVVSSSTNDACTARFHSDGKIDTGFSSDGKQTLLFSSDAPGYLEIVGDALAVQADGKVLVGGACRVNTASTVKQFCLFRYEGGPDGYRACSLDIDGDNAVRATTDALIMARVSLGMTGSSVTNGITFPAGATRTSWSSIRNYLVSQCGMSLAP